MHLFTPRVLIPRMMLLLLMLLTPRMRLL